MYVSRSFECLDSTCRFIELVSKSLLYATIPFFPFVFLSTNARGTTLQKQTLQVAPHQLGASHCSQKKKLMEMNYDLG
jgi:hypothetical protein